MPCYFPLTAYKAKSKDPQKVAITFRRSESWKGVELKLPCGQCIGCRLERSRQWAVRCMHEASLYERNSFITLTYDPKHLPADGSLHLEDFQNFMKKLRREYVPKIPKGWNSVKKEWLAESGIRFYHCGEYGENLGRPHYHALLFNHDFPDRKFFSSRNGHPIYTSNALRELWPMGHSVIGEVTFESADYVARYVMKKVTGEKSDLHYNGMKPEYVTMSRRPGIGKGWYEKYSSDVYPADRIIVRGRSTRPPRFYDTQLARQDPSTMALLKIKREENEKFVIDTLTNGKIIVESDSSARRLAVKEEVKRAEISELRRPLEGN